LLILTHDETFVKGNPFPDSTSNGRVNIGKENGANGGSARKTITPNLREIRISTFQEKLFYRVRCRPGKLPPIDSSHLWI